MAVSASTSSFSFSDESNDVFLSFRGPDTREGFTGFLYKALCDKGIRTFIDNEELRKGDQIESSLVEAIQNSKIAIVVFSENYASSLFCLDELVHINDCKEKAAVFPVFYNVDPSNVRRQKGSYGEALVKHEEKYKVDMERLKKWKMALKQVADLYGWHYKRGDGYEYKFIEEIVEAVSNKINRGPLHVANYPVGLESRVSQVNSLLYDGSDDGVCMVGIYGIGGIGKTTVARAVYNLIGNQFNELCFLEDVRKKSMKHGLVHLQETLLSKIAREKYIKLDSVNEGIPIIKQKLHKKKVFLVVDDVDKMEQLQAIVGRPDWFGFGSKVIITTRDKDMLIRHGVERTYEVEELNKEEAFELLTWNAFRTHKVNPTYVDCVYRAITYVSGLPMALEVIGSYMYGKKVEDWEYALDRYKRIPNKDIQEILKVSFDSLEKLEQEIFLDIACCFKGYALTYVKEILYAHHGVCSEHSLRVLFEKSLIKINGYGHLTMHDLIEDMGKNIVRQESLEEPGKRSRLWFHEDIVQVLEENTGTSQIEIIIIDFIEDKVNWDGEGFKKMTSLKTLIIRDGLFSKGPKHLPNSLRVLEWWGCPSLALLSDFYPKKLVILKLPLSCSMSRELLMSKKAFMNLSVLNFDACQWIKGIPDVSCIPKLEKLSFRECGNLVEIHESVGFLDELRILDVFSCEKLRTFPPIKLSSLEQLELSRCTSLESFPEILGKMENITHLYFQGTGIKKLPSSISYLTQLRWLGVSSHQMLYFPRSIDMLPALHQLVVWGCEGLQLCKDDNGEEKESSMSSLHLEYLDLIRCNISDKSLTKCLTCFANVKCLDLSYNNFTFLPACIQVCHLLRELKLDYCELLRQTNGIPPDLETLSAEGCSSLKHLDLTVLPQCIIKCHLRKLILDGCENLEEIKGIPLSIELLSVNKCKSLTYSFRSELLQKWHEHAGYREILLPGVTIPKWFEHFSKGPSISFWFRNKYPTISICIFIARTLDVDISSCHLLIKVNEVTRKFLIMKDKVSWCTWPVIDTIYILDNKQIKFEDGEDEVSSENGWNHVQIIVNGLRRDVHNFGLLPKSLEIGLRVVRQRSCWDDFRYTNPYGRISEVLEKPQIKELYNPNVGGSEPDKTGINGSSNEGSCIVEMWTKDLKKEERNAFLNYFSIQKLVNLSILDFDYCNITEIPDVSVVPNLVKLSCRSCRKLIKVHESVGFLGNLRMLDAFNCIVLRTFPPIKLASVEHLELSNCSSLESFPEILGMMETLTYLHLSYTSIKKLPSSIRYLTRLRKLEVKSSGMFYLTSSIAMLPELEHLSVDAREGLRSYEEDKGEEKVSSMLSPCMEFLNLLRCKISDNFLQEGLTCFTNVKYLDLSAGSFTILPTCIKEFRLLRELILDECILLREVKGIPPNLEVFSARRCESLIIFDLTACTKECHLKDLILDDCKSLRWEVKGIPPSLEVFSARRCTSLKILDLTACTKEGHLKDLILDDCKSLQEIRGIQSNIELLSATNCMSLTPSCRSMLLNQELHELAAISKKYVFPGTRIPEWFEHRSRGSSTFWFRSKFPTISLCFIVGQSYLDSLLWVETAFYPKWIINGCEVNTLIGNEHCFFLSKLDDDHIYIFFHENLGNFADGLDVVLLEDKWNHVEVFVNGNYGCKWEIASASIQMGLHVVKQKSCMEDIQFTNPY